MGQSPHPILSVRGSLSDLGTSIGCSTAGTGCSSCFLETLRTPPQHTSPWPRRRSPSTRTSLPSSKKRQPSSRSRTSSKPRTSRSVVPPPPLHTPRKYLTRTVYINKSSKMYQKLSSPFVGSLHTAGAAPHFSKQPTVATTRSSG